MHVHYFHHVIFLNIIKGKSLDYIFKEKLFVYINFVYESI